MLTPSVHDQPQANPAAGAASTLTLPSRHLDEREAARILEREWGVRGLLTRLAGERDDNFCVSATRSTYLLKITHALEPADVTNLATAALLHLEHVAPDFPVPRVLRTRSRQAEAKFVIDGAERTARLTTFADGTLLKMHPTSRTLRLALGSQLARLNQALRTFDHPAADRELLWDLQHIDKLTPLLSQLDVPRRDVLLTALKTWGERVRPHLDPLRRQIVHNDLSGDNVVFDPELQTVRAIIDFGDVVRTQLVNDVAIAISNQLSENEIPFELAVEVLSGYHTRDPLDPDELAVVYDLTWSRMLMRVIITEWRAHHFPENRAYVLRNTAHSWLQLERMMRKDPDSARNQVLRAIRQ